MKILLDSHVLLWALTGHPKLSERARTEIENPGNLVFYSAASIWELSLKHMLHPEHVEFSGAELCVYCDEAEYLPLEVKRRHVLTLQSLNRRKGSSRHKDPFDRMLLAQAKAEGMTLLTHDQLLADYGEPCVVIV